MRFPDAYKGVKKLFIAEIIGVIAALLVIVSAILLAIGQNNEPVLVAAGSLTIVSPFLLIVIFVIQIIGLYQGGKDESQIRSAFIITIVGVVLSLVAGILSVVGANNATVSTVAGYVNIVVDVATVIALIYTLFGISNLSRQLGNESMERFGRMLAWAVCILYVVSIGLNLFSNIINNNAAEWAKNMVVTAGIIAGVAELVVYILTFIYYGKATKMLKE